MQGASVGLTLRQTEQQLAELARIAEQEKEAAWRATLQPCAYLVGTAEKPSSISIYGISGGADRWLNIPLDLSEPPVTFAAQALAFVQKTPTVPFLGPTTGFIVNYTPDFAMRFDVSGKPAERLNHAYRPGKVTLTIGRQSIPAETLLKIAGSPPTPSIS